MYLHSHYTNELHTFSRHNFMYCCSHHNVSLIYQRIKKYKALHRYKLFCSYNRFDQFTLDSKCIIIRYEIIGLGEFKKKFLGE